MVEYELLKGMLAVARVLNREQRMIAVFGECAHCHKPISHIVTVYSEQTPREAFDSFWYGVAVDCEIASGA